MVLEIMCKPKLSLDNLNLLPNDILIIIVRQWNAVSPWSYTLRKLFVTKIDYKLNAQGYLVKRIIKQLSPYHLFYLVAHNIPTLKSFPRTGPFVPSALVVLQMPLRFPAESRCLKKGLPCNEFSEDFQTGNMMAIHMVDHSNQHNEHRPQDNCPHKSLHWYRTVPCIECLAGLKCTGKNHPLLLEYEVGTHSYLNPSPWDGMDKLRVISNYYGITFPMAHFTSRNNFVKSKWDDDFDDLESPYSKFEQELTKCAEKCGKKDDQPLVFLKQILLPYLDPVMH